MSKLGFKHSEETKIKISKSNSGILSSQWKGDVIGYQAIHVWIRNTYGKACKCESESCEGKSTNYEWALIKGKQYKRDINSFIQLCKKCHRKMDFTKDTALKISKAVTKHIGCSVKSCQNKHLAKGFCLHHYNVISRKSYVSK